jgi:hypothetical protein
MTDSFRIRSVILIDSPYPHLGRRTIAMWTIVIGAFITSGLPAASAQEPPPPPPPPMESDTATQDITPAPTTPPGNATSPTGNATAGGSGNAGGGRYLLLPDISFNGIFRGHLSTDKRDQARDRLRLDQAEVGIQSYVYPQIKLDSFIVFDGDGGVSVEEAYLTFQNLNIARLPLSATLGRRKVPFGRTNQLHPHSWHYAVQPYVLNNLVSPESLTGDGAYLSYLLPTGKVFAQLDAGLYTQSVKSDSITRPGGSSDEIVTTSGNGLEDKFGTARLVVANEILGGSAELGGSIAAGRGLSYDNGGDRPLVRPQITITGLDFTYRKESAGAKRLLLRGEYLWHNQRDGDFRKTATGYYLFVEQRVDPLTSVGLRYDSSAFPFADGEESGISLIGTKALTEATFFRLQYIHGDRPGKKNFDELHFQFVFGAGPHTHNLE